MKFIPIHFFFFPTTYHVFTISQSRKTPATMSGSPEFPLPGRVLYGEGKDPLSQANPSHPISTELTAINTVTLAGVIKRNLIILIKNS